MSRESSLIDLVSLDPGSVTISSGDNNNNNTNTVEYHDYGNPPSPAPAQGNDANQVRLEFENEAIPESESSADAELISKLVHATQYGHLQVCRTAIDDGFDVNLRDKEDVTLLHWAAINNRLELAKLFITKGAQVDAIGGELKSTPLHWAVRQRHLQMVIFLVSKHANPRILDGDGYSCLHVAAQLGHTSVLAYLIAKGECINEPDRKSMTPLMWAVYRQNA